MWARTLIFLAVVLSTPACDGSKVPQTRESSAADLSQAKDERNDAKVDFVQNIDVAHGGQVVGLVDDQQILYWPTSSTARTLAARIGSGPGEWRYAIWAGSLDGDVGVVDAASLRLLRFDSTLRVVSEERVPSLVGGGYVIGRHADGSFTSLIDPPKIPGVGLQRFETVLVRWRPGSAQVDTLGNLGGTDVFIDPAESMFVPVPGGSRDLVSVSDSISVAGNTLSDSVFIARAGETSRWVVLEGLPKGARWSDAQQSRFVRREVDETPSGEDRLRKQRTFKKLPVTASTPRVNQLLVDNLDHIYVAVPSNEPDRQWLIFDLNGQLQKSMQWPTLMRVWAIRDGEAVVSRPAEDGGYQLSRVRVPH